MNNKYPDNPHKLSCQITYISQFTQEHYTLPPYSPEEHPCIKSVRKENMSPFDCQGSKCGDCPFPTGNRNNKWWYAKHPDDTHVSPTQVCLEKCPEKITNCEGVTKGFMNGKACAFTNIKRRKT